MGLFGIVFKLMAIIFAFMGVFSGIVLMFVGHMASQLIDAEIFENSVKTIGTIKSIDNSYSNYDDYNVFVEYEVDGTICVAELNSYSSDYYIGKKVDILYNEDDFTQIVSADIQEVVGIFDVLKISGIFINIICSFILIVAFIKSKSKKKTYATDIVEQEKKVYAQSVYDNYKNEIRNECNKGPINLDSNSSDDGAIKYK